MGSFSPSDFLGPQPLARLLMDEFPQPRAGGVASLGYTRSVPYFVHCGTVVSVGVAGEIRS